MPAARAKDRVVDAFVALARCHPSIDRVALFGSRARGDARARSDYDFAVTAPRMSPVERAALATRWRDAKPTLLATDLVWTDEAQPELVARIQREGVEIYGR